MVTSQQWVGFLLVFLGVSIWSMEISARVCYYGQEADERGKLRWVMPDEDYDDRCNLCTIIKRGGVNPGRHGQLGDGVLPFKYNPLFTDNLQKIRQHFNCQDPPATTVKKAPFVSQKNQSALPGCSELYGAGYNVIQRRTSQSEERFNRSWDEYKYGFGPLDGDFWVGNEILHILTEQGEWQLNLKVVLDSGYTDETTMTSFRITGDNYTLQFSQNNGEVGNFLLSANNQPFSTKDTDNDGSVETNCASKLGGGWWIQNCATRSVWYQLPEENNLNGNVMRWGSQGMYELKETKMKIARFNTT